MHNSCAIIASSQSLADKRRVSQRRAALRIVSLVLACGLPPPAIGAPITLSAADEDAICRVAIAEAAREPLAGRAAVIEVILNRVERGFAGDVQGVVSQRAAFEPVLRAGDDWRALPAPTAAQWTECTTILALHNGGYLLDPSGGGDHFQNPQTVAQREKAGTVRPGTTNFGGMPVRAVVGHHTFYASGRVADAPRDGKAVSGRPVGEQRVESVKHEGLVVRVGDTSNETVFEEEFR